MRGQSRRRRDYRDPVIRHRHTPVSSVITIQSDGSITADFKGPQHGVAPGQAVVVYDGDIVLGGGWISGSR